MGIYSVPKMGRAILHRSLSAHAIQQIYKCTPLTPVLVHELNPDVEFESVLNEAAENGYPIA
jgi:hypothetical protein